MIFGSLGYIHKLAVAGLQLADSTEKIWSQTAGELEFPVSCNRYPGRQDFLKSSVNASDLFLHFTYKESFRSEFGLTSRVYIDS